LACDASADRVGEILSQPGVACKQTASVVLTVQAPSVWGSVSAEQRALK
jgi:hypothetical protein